MKVQISNLPNSVHQQYAQAQSYSENLPSVFSDRHSPFPSTHHSSTLTTSNLKQLSFFDCTLASWSLFTAPSISISPARLFCPSFFNTWRKAAEAKFHLFTHQSKLESDKATVFHKLFALLEKKGEMLRHYESETKRFQKS